MTNHSARRIKEKYNPDACDIAQGVDGKPLYATWAEYALLEMIETQQAQIDALKEQVSEVAALRMDLSALRERVSRHERSHRSWESEGF